MNNFNIFKEIINSIQLIITAFIVLIMTILLVIGAVISILFTLIGDFFHAFRRNNKQIR
jgi:uncharacterized membrane protein